MSQKQPDILNVVDNLTQEEIEILIQHLTNKVKSTKKHKGRSAYRKQKKHSKQKQHVKRIQKGQETPRPKKSRSVPTRIKSFDTSGNRPNKFLEMIEYNMYKKDSIIDRKLSAGLDITPRIRSSNLVNVICRVCGQEYTVNRSMIMRDPDTREWLYTCDNCIGG